MLYVINVLVALAFLSPLFFLVGRQSLELRIAESGSTYQEVNDFLRKLGFPLNRIYARPSWANFIAQKPDVDVTAELIKDVSQRPLAYHRATRFIVGAIIWFFMLVTIGSTARYRDAVIFPEYLLLTILCGGNFIFFWRFGRDLKRKSSDGES